MLKTLWRGWRVVAAKIGHVQSVIVLTLMYFVFVAPFALAVRLFSDPLTLRASSGGRWLPLAGAPSKSLAELRQQSWGRTA